MVILSTKLKNRFPKTDKFQLKTISVNGDKRGCSGFIQRGNNIVYVNTEQCFGLGYMYRTAKSLNDYTGGQNQWAKTLEELVFKVNKILDTESIDPVQFMREHFEIVHIK